MQCMTIVLAKPINSSTTKFTQKADSVSNPIMGQNDIIMPIRKENDLSWTIWRGNQFIQANLNVVNAMWQFDNVQSNKSQRAEKKKKKKLRRK